MTIARVLCVCLAVPCCLPAQTSSTADRLDPAIAGAPAPYIPMTEAQRFKQFLKDTANPISLVSSAAGAGLGQWRDRPYEWKQGGKGYGLRYGSSYAEHITQAVLIFGASSALHEDNRYVRSGQSVIASRVRHSLGSAFVARRDDGTRHISISKIGGFAAAALLSRLWQPPSNNSMRSGGINFGTSLAVDMGLNVVREFWPHK